MLLYHLSYQPNKNFYGSGGARTRDLPIKSRSNSVLRHLLKNQKLQGNKPVRHLCYLLYQLSYPAKREQESNLRQNNPEEILTYGTCNNLNYLK